MPNPSLGIITGLRSEARCLPPQVDRLVLCSGGDAERARQAAKGLVSQKVAGLLSFGLAGGLSPLLRPGDALLPEAVLLPDGSRVPTHPPWRARIEAELLHAGPRVLGGALAGSDRLLVSPPHKRELHRTTGALAVDMESHAVAAVASAAGLPFVVVRVVADPCDQELPEAARTALGLDGRARPLAVARALLRRPEDLLPLLRLARQSGRAHASLRRVALLAGAALDPG